MRSLNDEDMSVTRKKNISRYHQRVVRKTTEGGG